MGLDKRLKGHGVNECQCGRRSDIVHCNVCGSFRTYGYAGTVAVPMRDKVEYTKRYRCLKCGSVFTDIDREFCTAAFVESKTMAAARQIKIMRAAKADGHPLTDKEEVIAKGVDNFAVDQLPGESPTDYLNRREATLLAQHNGNSEASIEPIIEKKATREELAMRGYVTMMRSTMPHVRKMAYDLAKKHLTDNQILDLNTKYDLKPEA